MGAKEVSARWFKDSKALKKEDQIYGQRLAEMVKKHSREAFYAFDDPLEIAIFSMLIEFDEGAWRQQRKTSRGSFISVLRRSRHDPEEA